MKSVDAPELRGVEDRPLKALSARYRAEAGTVQLSDRAHDHVTFGRVIAARTGEAEPPSPVRRLPLGVPHLRVELDVLVQAELLGESRKYSARTGWVQKYPGQSVRVANE